MHSSISSSSRNGRRDLGIVVLCVAVFFAADRLVASVLWSQVIRSGFRYSVLYREPVNADILVLGNSRGMSLVDWPHLEGATRKKVFNLSYNGLPVTVAKELLADYLERNRAPQVLLLEMSAALGSAELENEFKLYARESPRLRARIEADDASVGWGLRISELYAFNGELTLRALYYRNRNDHDWLIDGTMSPELIRESNDARQAKWQGPTAESEAAMVAVVQMAKSRGITVVPVVAPYWPAFVQHSSNAAEIFQGMERLIGMRLLDYSQAIADPTLFADRFHINRAGSLVFTDRLIADGVLNTPAR